ncbi:MAG: cytidylate kinase-like family protein [Desulfobacteraceae bacterium]
METKKRSISKIIEEQVKKWDYHKQERNEDKVKPVISVTISREPGSGGRIVAEKIAERLNFDIFHQEVVHEMAEDANISVRFIETLDERGLNTLDNWIASMVDERYLWPDRYMKHLMKVVGTMGRHGNCVIVGRGSNFIIPPEKRISARITAPFDMRCRFIADAFNISVENAARRITHTESTRRSFIRKYFNTSIADPANYDMVLNTKIIGIDGAAAAVSAAVKQKIG